MSSIFMANRLGIPCIQSKAVSVTSSAVVFTFNAHPQVNAYFQGIIAVKISNEFTAPTTAVKVQFATEGVANSTRDLVGVGGDSIMSDDWNGTGIYLCFYDRSSEKLQLLT